ncbi:MULTISPECIES: helix-turn-helix domain-containing protein [Flavobacterium]|uniref:Helix-turn-helix domain-containing protein n=1 Tax=Flavobacterium jumunjinense TaxID=998845 RepID=A0ABV5GUE4_9FLAO|nr:MULTISPECIES: helix-turn-helix transcriptional regulator [Flavobacterium]
MENYISENISYLVTRMRSSQDELGAIFDLKRGTINTYISKKAQPKIDTIQRICEYFDITIDAFINTSLEETKSGKFVKNDIATNVATNIDVVAKEIEIRDELIAFYKEKVESYEKEKNTLEIITRIENKLDTSLETNKTLFSEIEEYFELMKLKENLEKAKNIETHHKSKK